MCAPICKSPPSVTGKFDFIVKEKIADIDVGQWNSVVNERFFFAATEHLAVVEKTAGDQFKPVYVMVNEGNNTLAVMYLQLLHFSFQNAVRNFRWKSPFWKSLISWLVIRLLSKLKVPLLQSGNIFFTGDTGIYFQEGLPQKVKKEIIHQVLKNQPWKTCLHLKASATMVSNLFRRVELKGLDELGFYPIDTEPDLWMEVASHWENPGDYLSDLSSKYRVRANKVLQSTSHLEVISLSCRDISESEDTLLSLYRQVADKADFNMANLQKGYFTAMKEKYGEAFQVDIYKNTDRIIGFTSTFYVNSVAHAHYIGIDYSLAQNIPLYNRMLLDFVQSAIFRNCTHLHLGRTATEIKTTVGAQPVPMHGYLRLENRFLNRLLPLLLGNFGAAAYIPRHPFREQSEEILPSTCSFSE